MPPLSRNLKTPQLTMEFHPAPDLNPEWQIPSVHPKSCSAGENPLALRNDIARLVHVEVNAVIP